MGSDTPPPPPPQDPVTHFAKEEKYYNILKKGKNILICKRSFKRVEELHSNGL